MLEQSVRISC